MVSINAIRHRLMEIQRLEQRLHGEVTPPASLGESSSTISNNGEWDWIRSLGMG